MADGAGGGGGGGGQLGGAGGSTRGGDDGGFTGSDGADLTAGLSVSSANNPGGPGSAVITYDSYTGAPLYSGGTITASDSIITHTLTGDETLIAYPQGPYSRTKAGFVNVNGNWQQFWPPNVRASILVVAGGGGGGIGYGWEGGGGGGAGGVVYAEEILLDSRLTYNAIVGSGGGANASGNNSYFGLNSTAPSQAGVNVAVYPASYPVYNGFLNTYGVWTSPDFVSPVGSWVNANYQAYIPVAQTYQLIVSADNHIQVSINGSVVGANDNWGSTDSNYINLPAGIITITCQALNDGGPASFAAALYDPPGNVIWHTRMTDPIQYDDGWFLAIGGGNGGYGTASETAGSGGSGGGGCGYVNTHGGGSGIPGQGNSGGTGIWQGYGQAGGGGGGGAGSSGSQSNGNQGGDGGFGITYLGLQIAGGGAGGYGEQGSGGSGPGGVAVNGGGQGNGGHGAAGTGGGGGGSAHSNYTAAGDGGSGIVVVQYSGVSPAFLGGNEIIVKDGYVTHKFTSVGRTGLTAK